MKYIAHVPLEATNWPVRRDWVPLDELCHGIWDCPHSTPKITTHGPLVVRSQDIRSGVFRTQEAATVSEETYTDRIARAEPSPGDILYSREGTYFGIAAEMPKKERVCLGQRMVLIRPDPEKANSRFIWAWLNSQTLTRHVHGFRDGTVAERLNMPTIRSLPVPVFSQTEQDHIGSIAGTLTDKIELNRRINETLEALAQAIFKDWFVTFGPVRRKMEGATDPVAVLGGLLPDPTRATEVAALFPDSFGDDGLPEGWARQTVDTLFELAYGKSLPKTERRAGRFPVYGSGGINGTHETPLVPGPSIIVGRKGTVGSLFWEQENFFPIDTVFYVKPANDVSLEFLWFLLKGLGLEHMNTDAAVPGLNRNNVYRLEVPSVPASLIEAFTAIAGLLREKQESNNAENHTLAETRDYLLPKLMSGEVRVHHDDAMAEEPTQ